MFIDLTYLKLNATPRQIEVGKAVYYYTHQGLTVRPESIKWMVKNHDPKRVLLNNDKIEMITPPTMAFIDGLGEVFLKEERMFVRDLVNGKEFTYA